MEPLQFLPDSRSPLYRQIYLELRRAILSGQLGAGQRLPSSRALAEEWNTARNSVLHAMELLEQDGYTEARAGSGTFIKELPLVAPLNSIKTVVPGKRGRALACIPAGRKRHFAEARPLQPGLPDFALFPQQFFARANSRALKDFSKMHYSYPEGLPELRQALALLLHTTRAVSCNPEQIIVTTGSQQALYLAAMLLSEPGSPAIMEDPCYGGAHAAFLAAGLNLRYIAVDRHGLQVSRIPKNARQCLACVTPSHQFPLGFTMSLERRLELLAWARATRSVIIEDDYDSDYCHAHKRLPAALQGLDQEGRVLYTGTFSKLLAPGLRMGYLVVPETLAPAFASFRSVLDRQPPAIMQKILADFIASGRYLKERRRLTEIYSERRACLVRQIASIEELQEYGGTETGLHVAVRLKNHSDKALSEALAKNGFDFAPLSEAAGKSKHNGFALGFAAFSQGTIKKAMLALKKEISLRK